MRRFWQAELIPFDHFSESSHQNVENAEIAALQSHLKGLHVQPVAGQHAAVIAPSGIRGGAAAAGIGAVDHVVVNQCRAVQKLDDSGEANGAAVLAAGVVRREAGARDACAFLLRLGGTRDFGNGRKAASLWRASSFLNQEEVVADQIKNLFRR